MKDNLVHKSLSNKEISNFFDNKINVITYESVHKFKTIDELLYPHDATVILFLTMPNYGHWTIVFKNNSGGIEFFDPYGLKIDSERMWAEKKFRDKTYQNYPYLLNLLYKSGYTIEYNHNKFQKKEAGINTCGRWVIMRYLFKDLKLNDFIKLFNVKNADEIITKLTYFV